MSNRLSCRAELSKCKLTQLLSDSRRRLALKAIVQVEVDDATCLPVCLPSCFPACLPTCLPACLPCLPALPACLSALPACLPTYLPALLPAYLPTYLPDPPKSTDWSRDNNPSDVSLNYLSILCHNSALI